MEQTSPTCFSCGKPLDGLPLPIGRKETCPHCDADVHVCKNCGHYDTSAYNDCREPQAERVVEKERSNFCDYFTLAGGSGSSTGPSRNDVMKQLDDLFKK
ncbi:MAG: hypothetical protein KDD44_10495 [Bdellovibrionales bacterium]|nr:hypothetical protein [Bdellovibrionales bacterium]